MKQIYKITYPTGKIYIGKDSVGSHRYFGSPSMDLINEDFESLPPEVRKDYSIRKEILWESKDCSESELSQMEVKFIREFKSISGFPGKQLNSRQITQQFNYSLSNLMRFLAVFLNRSIKN